MFVFKKGEVGNWVRTHLRSVDATKFTQGPRFCAKNDGFFDENDGFYTQHDGFCGKHGAGLSTIADAAHAGSARTKFIVW